MAQKEKETAQVKAASTLNANQIKKTISGAKVQKRKAVVQALESPFVFDWSHLLPENEADILSSLSKVLSPVRAESKGKLKTSPKDDINTQNPQDTNNEAIIAARKHLAIGLRDVTKAVSQSEALIVFCEKNPDPSLLTKLLIPLCQNKGIPLVPIKRFSTTVSKPLNVLRCLTFALKMPVSDPGSPFSTAYSEIIKILNCNPGMPVSKPPTAQPAAKITVVKKEPATLRTSNDTPPEEPSDKYYLKRGNSGVRFIPKVTKNPLLADDAAQKNLSTFGADFIALKPVTVTKPSVSPGVSLLRRPKLKRVERDENNPKKKKKALLMQ